MSRVRRPSRYTGGEWNETVKTSAEARIALAYPDVYEVGMSNLGLRILYELINADERFAAERVFYPWTDMREEMEGSGIPLLSLETKSAIADFDVLGISLQSELTYSNIIGLLDIARIPRRSVDRSGHDPLVVAGGPGVFNPEPLSPFFDCFVIGEAEEAAIELMAMIAESRRQGWDRAYLSDRLASLDGIYVPVLAAEPGVYPLRRPGGTELKVKKRLVTDLDSTPIPRRPVVPYLETIHDRCVIEVTRGCGRGCRFCQAGMVYRPVRERCAETIVEAARTQARATGYSDISLASLSTTDHTQIKDILEHLGDLPEALVRSISLPSMRTDRFSVGLAETIAGRKKTGLTFAPEAGTARLRAVINKGVTEGDMLSAAEEAFRAGWERLKLYFMIGLPTETDEDVLGIAALTEKILETAEHVLPRGRAKRVKLTVSVSTFVPKPHTPFQWAEAIPMDEIVRRQVLLKERLPRKRVDFKWHEAGSSILESALARGDAHIADAIERAYDLGAEFDGWSDRFSLDTWRRGFAEVGLDLDRAAAATFALDGPLPWDHIDSGVDRAWLRREYEESLRAVETPDCRFGTCSDCGVCGGGVRLELAEGERR